MKGTERLIHFFELRVDVNKNAATPPTLSEVLDRIKDAYDAGSATLKLNKETATIEICDFVADAPNSLVTIYFRYADKNGSDVYFTDIENKTSRIERKRAGEGRGYGAHLVLSLQEEPGRPNSYSAVLERMTGVNSTFVVRLLQSILREAYQKDPNLFTCDERNGARDRNGRPKRIGFRAMVDLHGLPSDQFIADLEEGALDEIELIEDKPGAQFGGAAWLTEKQRVVKLNAGRGVPGVGQLWGRLVNLFRQEAQNNNFDRARIKFRRSDGQRDVVEIDAEAGTLLDQRYVKAKRITEIDPPMDECSDTLVPHFAEILTKEIIANR